MILNHAKIREVFLKYEGKSAELGELGFLYVVRCFHLHQADVSSTEHFCESCRDYKPLCSRHLKRFEDAGGREVEG